jgi:hypothetical protein
MATRAKEIPQAFSTIPSVSGVRSTPNPEYYDIKWPELVKLGEQHEKLREQAIENGKELQMLHQELRYQRERHDEESASALRQGKQPPEPDEITRVERRIKKLEEKQRHLERAAVMVAQDVHLERQERGEAVSETLAERRREYAERYQELLAEAERIRTHVEDVDRFMGWLTDA